MTLIDQASEKFILMKQVNSKDGYGGYNTTWSQDSELSGAMMFEKSNERLNAQSHTVSSTYVFTTKRSTVLMYHDVIVRKRDMKAFRVTSDGDDMFSPLSSSLDMRQVTCEEWELS